MSAAGLLPVVVADIYKRALQGTADNPNAFLVLCDTNNRNASSSDNRTMTTPVLVHFY